MTATNQKVIIFDDDEDILSICAFILEEKGYTVKTYTDCNQVIERVSDFGPDVIFMDNWIPDEGGIIATRKLKKTDHLKNIPVIYFSANREIKTLMKEAGADTFLAKPFELAELEDIIKKTLSNNN